MATNNFMNVKTCIEQGNVAELDKLLNNNPALANERIVWGPENRNLTDPLHFVSDFVFNGQLNNHTAAEIATVLIQHGALINGSKGSETPLIGATSLHAGTVANLLVDQGADIHAISVHGATALHWSCYTGLPETVVKLLGCGANLEQKCTQFHATPLFWAIHAVRYGASTDHTQIIEAVNVLLDAGADKETCNFEDYSARQLAEDTGNPTLITLMAV